MMTSLTRETGLKHVNTENMKSNQTSTCVSLTSDQIHVNQVRLHVTRLLRFVPQTLQTDRLTLIRERLTRCLLSQVIMRVSTCHMSLISEFMSRAQ